VNDKPLNITGFRQLMVDPRIVAESYNAFACMAEAEKHGRVIGLPDKLKGTGQLHGGSVMRDPHTNKIRIYYNVIDKATALREVATAESDDGLHFEYPRLDLRKTAGEPHNNFVRVSKDVPDTDRMLHARRADAAISLNGRLDEPAWQEASATINFIKTRGAELSEFATTARVLYDDQAVYVGFDCPGGHFRGEADAELGRQEYVEIFIDPKCSREHHYYFAVSCFAKTDQNRTMPAEHPLGEAWKDKWQASVDLRDDGWSAVARIPYDVLELESPGSAWGFNLGYNVPNVQKDAYMRYTNWAINGLHGQADRFGALVFDYDRFSLEQQQLWEDVSQTIEAEYNRSNMSIFFDPNPPDKCPPDERYKMTWRLAGFQYAATSADGYDFDTKASVIETGNLDSLNTSLWDPMRQKYVMYTRWWFRDPRGYPWQRRGVARTESESFAEGWPDREVVMDPCEFPGNARGERDFYNNAVFVHEGLYLAMTTLHYRNISFGPHAPALMVSTDSIDWQWVGNGAPIIRRSPGEWDSGMLVALVQPVTMGDRTYIYYAGTRMLHNDERRITPEDHGIGVASIRRDSFLGYWGPTGWPGTVTTAPLVFDQGDQLLVNSEPTSDAGAMRVEVLGDDRFTAEKCRSIRADSLDTPVQWDGAEFGALRGKPIQLRFHIAGVRLYAFAVR